MEIRKVTDNKKQYISLLLLADEQEDMIDRYLETGTMYVLDDSGVKAECVVTDEGSRILEIKNIAVYPEYQGRGYGKKLIDFLIKSSSDDFIILQVGTGDSPLTIPFYEKCGFKRHHKIKNFFIDNYDHPIFECGKQLIDMVYLQKQMKGKAYPKRSEALEILCEAEKLNPGPWVEHSKNVAHCAEAIAKKCENLNSEKAYVLGLLHDVGRRAGGDS